MLTTEHLIKPADLFLSLEADEVEEVILGGVKEDQVDANEVALVDEVVAEM